MYPAGYKMVLTGRRFLVSQQALISPNLRLMAGPSKCHERPIVSLVHVLSL